MGGIGFPRVIRERRGIVVFTRVSSQAPGTVKEASCWQPPASLADGKRRNKGTTGCRILLHKELKSFGKLVDSVRR